MYDSFIFTHIPKCGGTSFREYIYSVAKDSGVEKRDMYIPGKNGLKVRKNLQQLTDRELKKFKSRQYRVIAMHCYNDIHIRHSDGIKSPFYYTLLREPIARYLSHYFFFNYKNGVNDLKGIKPNDMTEIDFRELTKRHGNMMVKYLSAQSFNSIEINESHVSQAKENLVKGYGSYGIIEHMDKSLQKLRDVAPDWLTLNIHYGTHNSNRTVVELSKEISQKYQSIVKENNKWDIELYQFALDNFLSS